MSAQELELFKEGEAFLLRRIVRTEDYHAAVTDTVLTGVQLARGYVACFPYFFLATGTSEISDLLASQSNPSSPSSGLHSFTGARPSGRCLFINPQSHGCIRAWSRSKKWCQAAAQAWQQYESSAMT